MYCQVTQLEQQGGPKTQREMVRDREQAMYESVCPFGGAKVEFFLHTPEKVCELALGYTRRMSAIVF